MIFLSTAMMKVLHLLKPGNITQVIQQADINQLQQLLPCSPNEMSVVLSSDQIMLAIQVNHFTCGGLAISFCIWHAVADASTLATFVNSWAAITSGSNNIFYGEIFDCTTLFPPQELSSFSLRSFVKEDVLSEIVMKRFLFDGVKIAALRVVVGNGQYMDRLTRFEAVSALILRAMIAVTRENEATKISAATIAVHLRRRMKPPSPQNSIGNIYQVTVANWRDSESYVLNYSGLAGKVHEAIRNMSNDYIRKLHVGGGHFNYLKKASEAARKNPKLEVFGPSSWCKFPFYEADFG